MPRVYVDVDAYEVLEEISDEDLEEELASRRRKRGDKVQADNGAEPWTSLGMAEDLRTAFYARDATRFESLLCRLDSGNDSPIPSPEKHVMTLPPKLATQLERLRRG